MSDKVDTRGVPDPWSESRSSSFVGYRPNRGFMNSLGLSGDKNMKPLLCDWKIRQEDLVYTQTTL